MSWVDPWPTANRRRCLPIASAPWGLNDASYERFERSNLEGFGEWLQTEAHASPALMGLNVTIPYKQSIIPLLQDLTPTARAIWCGQRHQARRERMGRTQHRCGGLHEIPSPLFDFAHDRR